MTAIEKNTQTNIWLEYDNIDISLNNTEEALKYIDKQNTSKNPDKPDVDKKQVMEEIKKLLPEITQNLQNGIEKDFSELKDVINKNVKWERINNYLNNLENDVLNLIDEWSVNLFFKRAMLVWSTVWYLDEHNDTKTVEQRNKEFLNDKEIQKETKNFVKKLSNIIVKYGKEAEDMLNNWLKNNFEDVPEPLKSRFRKNKEDIQLFLPKLWDQIYMAEFIWKNYNNYGISLLIDVADNITAEFGKILGVQEAIEKEKQAMQKKIIEVEKNLENINTNIKETNPKENRQAQRWNIKYHWDTKNVTSWDNEVSVDSITFDSIKLTWLDVQLNIWEWLWLANFKNWFKRQYWNKKVEFKRDIINKNLSFGKTLVVGDTMLITRWDLEKRVAQCSDDTVVEKIVTWLNK